MAELSVTDRLQPSLLDRLIDDEPEKASESRDKKILSMNALRGAVMRDLNALFNATAMDALQDLSQFPLASQSVINFGLIDLSGKTATSLDVGALERVMRQAIWNFEPRLIRSSVQISLVDDDSNVVGNRMIYELHGELWGNPLPERIYLKTELDLDAGQVKVFDWSQDRRK